MDPLPALHPIVLLEPISSRPFEYTPSTGLTFKSYKRESVADLKQWLAPPKRKNSKPLKKAKDWWLAQLRLYGIEAKSSMTVPDLTKLLTKAMKKVKEPTEAILALEKELERKFLVANEEARNKEYSTLSDEQQASKYSHRFLSEKFFNVGENEKLLAVEIGGEGRRLGEVPAAAAKLGLHIENAIGAQKRRWIIVGKDKALVADRKCAMEKEWQDRDSILQEEAEERAAKRRKVEKDRQECESSGSFKDVEGEWSIDCPKMDSDYQKARRKMSIFFLKPHKRKYHSDEDDEDEEEEDDDDEDEDGETSALVLSANFEMGILEGVLRSSGELPPESICFPVPTLPFTWRGRETGEGEIQLDYEGDTNLGSFDFLSKTTLKGVLKSSYGKFPFTGTKVADVAVHKDDVWDALSERAHERERVGRW